MTLGNGFITRFLSDSKIKGFTLIEAIAVVAILAVIAGIAAPVVLTTLERVEKESTWEEMENIYIELMGNLQNHSRISTFWIGLPMG